MLVSQIADIWSRQAAYGEISLFPLRLVSIDFGLFTTRPDGIDSLDCERLEITMEH